MGVVMPVIVPIMLPRPRLISMKKNMTDQKGLAGKCVMASVKAMNARPVVNSPLLTLLSSSSSKQASSPSSPKLSSFTALMTPYISL
ncbi:hypothetical protein EYF80_006869 [Liparis tanakae]|uniref:Uncharacterized protein n=1 Tax=Liparis tanakae TaxID=230148 RepID=A0A4Z2J037_9TELE|nr:hypothetical protein EYF80_006869 [Liparis tanakae]